MRLDLRLALQACPAEGVEGSAIVLANFTLRLQWNAYALMPSCDMAPQCAGCPGFSHRPELKRGKKSRIHAAYGVLALAILANSQSPS